jgi:hypothetical protein
MVQGWPWANMQDPVQKITKVKMDWGHGSSVQIPVLPKHKKCRKNKSENTFKKRNAHVKCLEQWLILRTHFK